MQSTAYALLMEKRVMVGSVTVTDRFSFSSSIITGTTDPLDPSTLPSRTTRTDMVPNRWRDSTRFSAFRFVYPSALTGSAALSVLKSTNCFTPAPAAADTVTAVPMTLTLAASSALYSQYGTCLCAAAWNTRSTPRHASSTRCRSRTSPRRMRGFGPSQARSIQNRPDSSRSSARTLFTGDWRICRTRALPSVPAAPVTSTVLPVRSIQRFSVSMTLPQTLVTNSITSSYRHRSHAWGSFVQSPQCGASLDFFVSSHLRCISLQSVAPFTHIK